MRGFRIIWNWRQWYLGFWWWPIRGDRAFGICLGPVHLQWIED